MDKDTVKSVLLGLVQSKTAWLGAFLASMPDWWPMIQDQVAGLLGANASDKLVRIMGVLVVLTRFLTSKSLSEKGTGQ